MKCLGMIFATFAALKTTKTSKNVYETTIKNFYSIEMSLLIQVSLKAFGKR